MIEAFQQFFEEYVPNEPLRATLMSVSVAAIAVLSFFIARYILVHVESLIKKTESKIDDALATPRLLSAVSQLVPALVVKYMLPAVVTDTTGQLYGLVKTMTSIYILVVVVCVVCILISNSLALFRQIDSLRPYAIRGLFQMVQLVVICIGFIIGVSLLLGREPVAIVTAIGATGAVLMLVFKDTILGLVASIQLTANKMLREGDWIISDRHNVNGEVEDISLTTVKVRNWDNSVSTLPPYSLVSESFHNYQAMRHIGGRRVERAVLIDINSVRFLEAAELADLRAQGWLDGLDADEAPRVINLGLLRRYLDNFLRTDPRVNTSMLYMVRQMPPTATGLPLQLYFFTRATVWREFEQVQSDIFDHVYAIINRFGLVIFQSPSGTIRIQE